MKLGITTQELFEAFDWIFKNNNPTATGLQRRFGGMFIYRANVIEELEKMGYISKQVGCKKRKILASPLQMSETMKYDSARDEDEEYPCW